MKQSRCATPSVWHTYYPKGLGNFLAVGSCRALRRGDVRRAAEEDPGFLPNLWCAAVRALHGGADRGREHVATLAGVAGQVGRAAGLAHALGGDVRRRRGNIGWRWGEGLQRVGGGVLTANTLGSAPRADRMKEASSHCSPPNKTRRMPECFALNGRIPGASAGRPAWWGLSLRAGGESRAYV